MNDDASARLGLPYLAAGQMQKHVTLNEALTLLDAVVQTAVASRTTTVEPAEPADGALYVLPPAATGPAWSGMAEGALARAEAGGWSAVEASDGLVALIQDADELVVRHGGRWVAAGARLGVLEGLTRIGLGGSADASNPFLAKLNQALWTALERGGGGTGDLRLILNKEGGPDVLSLLLQSGYGGRAELGLIGDDDLRLKVSADGSNWNDALMVERGTGRAWFARGALRRETTILSASGDYDVPAWARVIEAVAVGGGGSGGAGAHGASGPRFGGGGGGAGGVSEATWPADQISAGLTVVIGDGGGGGAGAGEPGGDTTLHRGSSLLLTGQGGGGGGLGDGTSGYGGAGGAGSPEANRGGQSMLSATGEAGRGFDRPDGAGGGGAGGALDGAGVARAGGEGGRGGALTSPAWPGAGGSSSGGGDGQDAGWPRMGWAGAGGGGGGANGAGAGHAGGSGGTAGAGGGGGGAGIGAGGAGGDGAPGVVWLTAVG